jgi:hypothetical protein
MVGLMLAFQFDRWRESIEEREQERIYIARLIADVQTDIPAIEYAIELQTLRLELIDLLIGVAKEPVMAVEQPVVFLGSVIQASYTYTPVLTAHTFNSLRSTGDLRLILNESIKRVMFDYYGFDESQHQFRPIQFEIEFHHFKLSAGVLNLEQAMFMQDTWPIFTPSNFDTVKAIQREKSDVLAAANRLHERPQLIAWLPQVRAMQLEQIGVHSTRLERAQLALENLNDYAREIDGSD